MSDMKDIVYTIVEIAQEVAADNAEVQEIAAEVLNEYLGDNNE